MKYIYRIIVIVFLMNSIFAQQNEDNILQNYGFELSKNKIIPDGWLCDDKVYSLDNRSASGNYSLKYFNDDPDNYKLCSQKINVKAGMTYTAGITIKTANIIGDDYGASFCIQWLDKNGNWLGGVYPTGVKGTNDWTEINTIVAIPDNAVSVIFYCYVRKGMTGTAWFDNAYVKNYLQNKLNVNLISPLYRGLIIKGEDSEIKLSVDLNRFNIDLSQSKIITELFDSSGNEIFKDTRLTNIDNRFIKINFDINNLPIGSYKLNVQLVHLNDYVLDSWQTSVNIINSSMKPDVYFDNYKRLIVDDKPFFPLGMYWSSINEADLILYAESKFNFLLPYTPPNDEQMELVNKYKLKLIYSVKDFYAGTKYAPPEIKSYSDEIILLDNTIEHFKNDSAIIAWYINDELITDYINRLNDRYDRISDLDPDHPILSIIVNPSQSSLYNATTDVIGTDPYVVPKLLLSDAGLHTRVVNQRVDNIKPVWMVVQAHNIGNYSSFISKPEEYRTPTYNEMRSIAWQMICEGATGLLFYSFFDLKKNPDVSFESQWQNLKKIVAEIAQVSDILLSVENTDEIKVDGITGDNSWFNWLLKSYNNVQYLFVINNGKANGEIQISVPEGFSNIFLLNDPSKIFLIGNSKFTDSLKNQQLKIYGLK